MTLLFDGSCHSNECFSALVRVNQYGGAFVCASPLCVISERLKLIFNGKFDH